MTARPDLPHTPRTDEPITPPPDLPHTPRPAEPIPDLSHTPRTDEQIRHWHPAVPGTRAGTPGEFRPVGGGWC
jgi:hypothetical protein